jgi:hypothetical protein
MDDVPVQDPADLVEVGASRSNGTLRFALATHAMRHGEVRLASQVASLAGLQTRATQLMSWSIAGATALFAAALTTAWRIPASVTSLLLFATALLCLRVLWPKTWSAPGYEPSRIIHYHSATELEMLENLALGYDQGIRDNAQQLEEAVGRLRVAWACLLLAPVAGVIALLVVGLPSVTAAAPTG